MEWINNNSGILVLIFSIITIALIALCIWFLFSIRSKIITQKLKFLGFYSVNRDTKKRYAELTIGNKALNDIVLDELGIQNGKVNFPLTEVYKRKKSLRKDARIVIEQRSSINLELSCEELRQLVLEKNGNKILKTLRIYAVDMTGTLYRGKIKAIKNLTREILVAEEKGMPASTFASVSFPITIESGKEKMTESIDINKETAITDSSENNEEKTITEE